LETEKKVPTGNRVHLRIRGSEVLRVDDGIETTLNLWLQSGCTTLSRRPNALRVIAFSDYRTQDIRTLIRHLANRKPDLVLYGGDDLDRFHCGGENLFEELARHAKYGLCAVAGNDDKDGHAHITGDGVYAVHRNALIVGAFAVVGLEGAPRFAPGSGDNMNKGYLLYPDFVTSNQIRRWKQFNDKILIVVSHTPPFGTLDTAMRFGTRSIGSKLLRDHMLATPNIALCVCGHVHSSGGCSARLGRCVVVNAASHDGKRDVGKIAEMVIKSDGGVSPIEWTRL
jgi:Icc-related predicted phosphoesterase